MSAKLNDRQEAFCIEYLVDLNASQAAIRAGYAPDSSRVTGSKLLAKANIQERVAELKAERSKRTQIDADWVLTNAKRLFDRCMQEEQIKRSDGSPVLIETPDGELAVAYKFDSSGANKALETIGKHVFVKAFDRDAEEDKPKQTPINVTLNVEDASKHEAE